MPSDVNIKVGADAVGFHREMRTVDNAIKSIGNSAKLAFGSLKGYLIGTIGIATIDKMVGSSLEYGESMLKTSKLLGTSIDRAAQLNKVVESLGENGEWLAKSMEKSQKYIRSAIGDKSKMQLLNKFGIGQEDIKNYDFSTVLNKALTATKGMSRADAQLGLSDIFGKGTGAMLLSRREQILASPTSTGIDARTLAEIKEAKFALKELNSSIKVLILQAILPLISKLQEWNMKGKDVEADYDTKAEALKKLYYSNAEKTGNKDIIPESELNARIADIKDQYEGVFQNKQMLYGMLADEILRGKNKEADLNLREMGGVIISRPAKTENLTNYQERLKEELARKDEENKITNEDLVNNKSIKTDEFIRMGGVMGINNIEPNAKYLQKQVELLKDIKDALESFGYDTPESSNQLNINTNIQPTQF